MEEILASIRRIIAEDGEQAPAADKPTAAAPTLHPAEDSRSEEVLELTEVVEDEVVQPAEPAPHNWASAEPAPHDGAPAAAAEAETFAAARLHDETGDRLVSDAAAAASMAALAQIQQLGGRKEQPMNDISVGDGQRTIAELVREMLRPLLKEWLDSNLPSLVERVVRDEVDRLVRDVRRG